METPIKMDDLGVPIFQVTTIYVHTFQNESRIDELVTNSY